MEHLCPRLGPSGLNVLYSHLRDLPPQYEEMHVELIRQFAEAASSWGVRGSGAGGSVGSGAGGREAAGGVSDGEGEKLPKPR